MSSASRGKLLEMHIRGPAPSLESEVLKRRAEVYGLTSPPGDFDTLT